MLIRAAVVGLGVALVPRCLAEDELESGALKVLMSGTAARIDLSFYLVVPATKSAVHGIRAFTEWILNEAHVGER
jgi:DNA-binding transcriptional LysR family regulator